MSDKFDPSEFDAPIEAPDHTVLFDAIRQAAASGVQSASAPLVAAASEIQRQVKELRAAERSVQTATASLAAAKSALFWDNAKHVLLYAAGAGFVLGGVGVGYDAFLKPAKIEKHYAGCTDWNARADTCRGKWVPLVITQPDETGR